MTASTQSYCTGEQCSLPSCLPACQPANHRYGNLYHQRQCFHLQGGWNAWPVAAVALLHAKGCFGSTDHLAGGAVFVQHDVYAHLHPALVQPHVARPVDHWARNPELWSLSTTSRQTSAWFMRKSHHYDVSIIHLVKNIWDKDPNDRTISLNANFIILFKNPSHMSQISHLDKQVYLSGNGLLRAA